MKLAWDISTKRFVRATVAVSWACIAWASLFGCAAADGPTQEALAPHFIAWLIAAGAGLVMSAPLMWRATVPSWCRTFVVVGNWVVPADVIVTYGICVCTLRLRIDDVVEGWVAIAALTTTGLVAVVALIIWIPVVVALLSAVRGGHGTATVSGE